MRTSLYSTSLAISLAITCWAPAQAELVDIEDFSIGSFVGEQLSNAVTGAQQAQNATGSLTRDLQRARQRYFWELRSGDPSEESLSAFQHQLFLKDLWYLNIAIITGVSSDMSRFLGAIAPLDGGIRPSTGALFRDWAREVRLHLGAINDDDPILINPVSYVRALEGARARGLVYLRARDRAELFESGVPLETLFSRETFALLTLEDHYARFDPPDVTRPRALPQEAAAELFALLVDTFGRDTVLEAADIVRKTKVDPRGRPVDLEFIEYPPDTRSKALNLFDPFYANLYNSPKGYVIHIAAEPYVVRGWKRSFEEGIAYYDDLVDRHGEAAVTNAAIAVLNAPKNRVGRLADASGAELQYPRWWLDALLNEHVSTVPTAPEVRNFDVIEASDLETFEAARKAVQFGTVVGTIEDIMSDESVVNFVFAGTDGKLFLQIVGFTDSAYSLIFDTQKYGRRGKGLIGKRVQISGRLEGGSEFGWWLIRPHASSGDKLIVLN